MYRLLLVVLASLIPLAICQSYGDVRYECKHGYRVAALHRESAEGTKVGAMSLECEAFDFDTDPVCTLMPGPYICDGKDEPCLNGTWLGGLHGFELDRLTGALLFQPICCSDPKVRVLTNKCGGRRLNAIRSGFTEFIAEDQLITSMQCWKQYDVNNVIHDFIWKPKVCEFEHDPDGKGPTKTSLDPSICEECSCKCGPFKCSDTGRGQPGRAIKLIHRRRKRSTCQCICDCDFRCI